MTSVEVTPSTTHCKLEGLESEQVEDDRRVVNYTSSENKTLKETSSSSIVYQHVNVTQLGQGSFLTPTSETSDTFIRPQLKSFQGLFSSQITTMKSESLGGSKKKRIRVHNQKFRKEWQSLPEFEGWLVPGSTSDRGHCNCCNKELTAGKSEFIKHASGKKHKKRFLESKGQQYHSPEYSEPSELSSVLDDSGISHTLQIIDLRSDTLTQPSREMREAMLNAPVGDDAFNEDPTVKELEIKVSTILEKEAAVFVPSGTMANLICIFAHCWTRGSQVILGDRSHLNEWAQEGIAHLGNVCHKTINNLPDGTFSLSELQAIVQKKNPLGPITSLVCIENTHSSLGGKALPLLWLDDLGMICKELNIAIHLDGARLINASMALGVPPARIVTQIDSVSLCFNKGLGAPMGSMIVGSKNFIERCRSLRKMLGGGLHQMGMFAAAAIYALDHMVTKLATDHRNARAMAQGVMEEHSSAVTVDLKSVQTNIILLQTDNVRVNAHKLTQRLHTVTDCEADELGEQIVVMVLPLSETTVRIMTHCDIKKDQVKAVIKKLKYIIREYDQMVWYKISV